VYTALHSSDNKGEPYETPETPQGKALVTVAAYREAALQVALDPTHPRHLLPEIPKGVQRILEVGCHAGHILEALRLPQECQAMGCDLDFEVLRVAHQYLPGAYFSGALAEALPYQDSSFDMLFSRAVATALDIPKALVEFNRVLRVGGRLWISLYRWSDCWVILRINLKRHPAKTLMLATYAMLNSALFHYTGKLVRYPLNRSRMMSFQTESRMQEALQRAGFGRIVFTKGNYFLVEADKLRSV
jgi:ubiquinone/menaquinone biosynthesis C-methylase UbiE